MVQVGPQWSQWILKWPQTVPESPRQSFKFQKSSQVLPFSYQLFISTARCSRRSSVSKFSDNLLLIPQIPSKPTFSFECSKWSKWVLSGPNGSSFGPRQSQTVPDSSKFQKSFQFWPFFRMEINYLLAPPGALGGVAFQNFLIISPLSSKSHPSSR